MSSLLPEGPTRVAFYGRVSTDEQAETGNIELQINFLRQYGQLYGLPVVGEFYDDGFSGTLPLRQRPEGRRLLEEARAGRFDVVVVKRVIGSPVPCQSCSTPTPNWSG